MHAEGLYFIICELPAIQSAACCEFEEFRGSMPFLRTHFWRPSYILGKDEGKLKGKKSLIISIRSYSGK